MNVNKVAQLVKQGDFIFTNNDSDAKQQTFFVLHAELQLANEE
jgi:hypothetical protein